MCAKAPDGEIEITPEMMDAGEAALAEHDPRFEGDREMIARIYRLMRAAELLSASSA